MANIQLVNRYKQLLASIPKGSFYASDGQVVPLRSSPYDLRIATSFINRQLGLFINQQFMGVITTDASGMAIIVTPLQKGRNDIQLIDATTQQSMSTYITTRDYATWMASEAQAIESIDQGVEQVLLDARLATSSISLIETVFGQTVATGNSFGYDLDTYRGLLQELRTAYRYFGASDEGISRAVRAFTQISPLIYPRAFGPRWILGKDLISPKEDTADITYYTTSPLTNINAGGQAISIVGFGSDVGTGTGTLFYTLPLHPHFAHLSWQPPNNAGGNSQIITSNGLVTLYGSDYFDPIISLPETYVITAGRNDQMSIEVDNKGIVQFTLPTGGAVTAASVVSAINTALIADIRYGVGYGSVASVYNAFGGTNCIALTTPNDFDGGSVTLHTSPGADGVQTIFDIPTKRGGFGTPLFSGTVIQCTSNTDMTRFPSTASTTNPFNILIGVAQYNPAAPASPSSPATVGTSELAQVIGVNVGLKQLTLSSALINSHNGDLITVDSELAYKRNNVQNARSIIINVLDHTLLPGSSTSDNITIQGSGAPDTWVITTDSGANLAPTLPLLVGPGSPGLPESTLPFEQHIYFSTDRDIPFDVNGGGMLSIPVPNEVLQFKGFPLNVSIWGRVDDPTRASPQTDIDKIGLSFDNQFSYTYFTPTQKGVNVNTTWQPKEYLVSTFVPSNATKMWIQMRTTQATNGNFTVHKVRATVLGHDGLFLGNGTIPRNEAKIKQGAFIYVWSPNQLTANEALSLGTTTETNVEPGHIDTIAPAQAWLDKFDVSTYDGGGNPTNIFGAFTDGDFLSSTQVNLDMVLGTPPRFTYLAPNVVSQQVDTLTWSSTSPFIANLSVTCDQDVTKAYLLEDGIPVTQDNWKFTGPTSIQLLYTPSGTSVYTFTYNALIQFESKTIDVGASFANFLWFADYHVFLRPEIIPDLTSTSTGLQFDATGRAILSERSNGDQTTATLIENTGLQTRIISPNQWSFIDNQTIQISLVVFNPGSLYQLNYVAEANHPSVAAEVLVEMKSATTSGGLATATYSPVTQNQAVGNVNEFYKFRVTLNNIRDIRDAKIESVLVKGLNLFGVGGTVPVLRPG